MATNRIGAGLTIQTRVKHQKFGEGVITHVTPEYLRVSFQEGGARTFAARIVEEWRLFELVEAAPVATIIQLPSHVSTYNDPEAVLRIADEAINTPRFKMCFDSQRSLQEVRRFVELGMDSLKRGGVSELRRLQKYLIEAIQPRLGNDEAQQLMAIARGEPVDMSVLERNRWKGVITGLIEGRRGGDLAASKKMRDSLAEEIKNDPVIRQIISAAQMIAQEMDPGKIGLLAHKVLRSASPQSFVYYPEETARTVLIHIRTVEKTWGKKYLSPDICPKVRGKAVDLLEDRRAVTILLMVLRRSELCKRYLNRSNLMLIRSNLKGFQNYRRFYVSSRTIILDIVKMIAEYLDGDIIPLAKGAEFTIPLRKKIW